MCRSGSIYRFFLHVNSAPAQVVLWLLASMWAGRGCSRRDQFPPAGFLEGPCSVDTLCKQSSEEKFLLILPVLQGKLMPVISSALSSMMHKQDQSPKLQQKVSSGWGWSLQEDCGFGPAKSYQHYVSQLWELLPTVSTGWKWHRAPVSLLKAVLGMWSWYLQHLGLWRH